MLRFSVANNSDDAIAGQESHWPEVRVLFNRYPDLKKITFTLDVDYTITFTKTGE